MADTKNIFSKINLLRVGLAVLLVAVVTALLPRADHQSFSYELNQPWRYPLLTAAFDMPILRDSASAAKMKDSIDAHFVPFVKRDDMLASDNLERFKNLLQDRFTPAEIKALTGALASVYATGVVDPGIYSLMGREGTHMLRMTEKGREGQTEVSGIDARHMLPPIKAFERVDSLYHSMLPSANGLGNEGAQALNICLEPNIVIDSVTDHKFRNQEYLNVTAALGVIKKGQRIVDLGEIITPQIFTNIGTYQEMWNQREDQAGDSDYSLLGKALYVVLCVALLYLFLGLYRSRFFANAKQMTFLMTIITLFEAIAIIVFEYVPGGLYLMPFPIIPVLALVFFDSRTAIFSLVTTVLIAAVVSVMPFTFVVMELAAGLVATFSIHQLSKRWQLLRASALAVLTYLVFYLVMLLMAEGNFDLFSWRAVVMLTINGVLFSFSYVLIVLIEHIYGFTSAVTLVELSDINTPLLRRLAEEAPGTFQHSMQVSMLAAEAARAIGANTQLVRTGALYHDIGKMENPIYFTENQHGMNPHDSLTPQESARKIISHVTGGLSMASKEKLPPVIRNFISEHHGRGLTRYFYNTAVNEHPDEHVDPEDFTYPGPNPQSKETAILMMADAVEAASRSLKDYSPESINKLVDKLIDGQIADGLLKEAPISLRDIETVKDTFKKRLATIYHSRIAYPELQTKPV